MANRKKKTPRTAPTAPAAKRSQQSSDLGREAGARALGQLSEEEKKTFPFARAAQILIGTTFIVFSGLAAYHRSLEDVIWVALAIAGLSLIAYLANSIHRGAVKTHTQAQVILWVVVLLASAAGILSLTSRFFGWPLPEWRHSEPVTSPPQARLDRAGREADGGVVLKPTLRLLIGHQPLNGADDPLFWLLNDSTVTATKPSVVFQLVDVDRPDPVIKDSHLQLRVPQAILDRDYVKPAWRIGPQRFREASSYASAVRPGDTIFGTCTLQCFDCREGRTWWVYLHRASDSWIYEIPRSERSGVERIMMNATFGKLEDPARFAPEAGREVAATFQPRTRNFTWSPVPPVENPALLADAISSDSVAGTSAPK